MVLDLQQCHSPWGGDGVRAHGEQNAASGQSLRPLLGAHATPTLFYRGGVCHLG